MFVMVFFLLVFRLAQKMTNLNEVIANISKNDLIDLFSILFLFQISQKIVNAKHFLQKFQKFAQKSPKKRFFKGFSHIV